MTERMEEGDTGPPEVAAGLRGAGDEVSQDQIFEVLRNRRRRELLRYLERHHDTAPLDDVVDHIASVELGKPVEAIEKQEHKNVYVGVYQSHIPKLEELGFLEYDRESRTVALTDKATALFPYLELDTDGTKLAETDVIDLNGSFLVRIDIPGFEMEDIDATVNDQTLRVTAVRTFDDEGGEVLRRERSTRVERVIELPTPVRIEDTEASYDKGVLEIRLAKRERPSDSTIEIS